MRHRLLYNIFVSVDCSYIMNHCNIMCNNLTFLDYPSILQCDIGCYIIFSFLLTAATSWTTCTMWFFTWCVTSTVKMTRKYLDWWRNWHQLVLLQISWEHQRTLLFHFQQLYVNARSGVATSVLLKIRVCLDVLLCHWFGVSWCFDGIMFLWNFSKR